MRMELTLDCIDPDTLATFWAAALGYHRAAAEFEGYVALEPPTPGFPALTLQRVPEPKTAKNRLHLDLLVADVDAEVARLLTLGAYRIADRSGYGTRWSVLADPEGNEFCVGQG